MRRSRLLTAWAALTVLAALLLWGVTFLDLFFAGQSVSEVDPCPYQPADHVAYDLQGLRFFCDGQLLGPGSGNPSYPIVLGALALNVLVLWLMQARGRQARQMLRVNLWTLAITLALGWPVLEVGERVQNAFLARGDVMTVQAGPALIYSRRCEERAEENGLCLRQSGLLWPNPTAWGIAGLALTGLAGLRRECPERGRAAALAALPGGFQSCASALRAALRAVKRREKW
ncbi:hypothetical protein Deipr_0549 [Deinococcus proteolyticus MRP]|uniref:Uncharacterized protein n=1 Tax=Deinococcus proteolyticus (strain ATCC 35074 / DSM 20540 / JCM 6276 / NBRC 101906 / NCIMB 13154 / VKM Ac-1939 / CCM 2703 / MRP) TaxID=693977 RepID=F0RKM1_DEIPM|nr:hypothetical protein [Deinococcus proteolyticus]ADY25711.1 hypothetical protein Deipr_0549 [Deinococcus proteolyticus MRP]